MRTKLLPVSFAVLVAASPAVLVAACGGDGSVNPAPVDSGADHASPDAQGADAMGNEGGSDAGAQDAALDG